MAKKTIKETTNIHEEGWNEYGTGDGMWGEGHLHRGDRTVTRTTTLDDGVDERNFGHGLHRGAGFASLIPSLLGGGVSFLFGCYIFVLLYRATMHFSFLGPSQVLQLFSLKYAIEPGKNPALDFLADVNGILNLATQSLSLANKTNGNAWATIFDFLFNFPYMAMTVIQMFATVLNFFVIIWQAVSTFLGSFLQLLSNSEVGQAVNPINQARDSLWSSMIAGA